MLTIKFISFAEVEYFTVMKDETMLRLCYKVIEEIISHYSFR